jgi:hypothetical protein
MESYTEVSACSQGGVNMPAIQEPVKEASIDSEHMSRVYMHIQSKAVPLRHAGAKRSYSSYLSLSWALDGDEWSASRPDR